MPDALPASARNVFRGRVTAIRPGTVNDEVTLQLAGSHTLVAVANHGACQALGLALGQTALALVKAPWVMLMTQAAGDGQISARNQWTGEVTAITAGGVNCEVTVTLPGGQAVHAVITQDAVRQLGLAVGRPATAIVKASDVLLAAAD